MNCGGVWKQNSILFFFLSYKRGALQKKKVWEPWAEWMCSSCTTSCWIFSWIMFYEEVQRTFSRIRWHEIGCRIGYLWVRSLSWNIRMYPSHTRMNTCRSFRTVCAFPSRSILISSYQAQQMCQKRGLISAKLSPGLCLSPFSMRNGWTAKGAHSRGFEVWFVVTHHLTHRSYLEFWSRFWPALNLCCAHWACKILASFSRSRIRSSSGFRRFCDLSHLLNPLNTPLNKPASASPSS